MYPGSRWVVVRKDLQTVKRNTLPSWDKIRPNNFFTVFNGESMTATATNGSKIIFFGENYTKDKHFDRWRGLECNGFLLEEINELQEGGYNKAMERAGSYIIPNGKQPPPLILATCNPTHGWVKDTFYDRWEKGLLKANQLFIKSRIYDNPFIPKDYIENLKNLPRYEYMVFVEGDWNVRLKSGGEFLKSFELEHHVKVIDYDTDSPLHVSIDNNVLPYIAISFWQVKKKETGYILRKVHEIAAEDPNNTARRASKLLLQHLKEIDYNDKIFLYGDATTKAKNTIDDENKSFLQLFKQPLIDKGYNIEERFFRSNPPVASTAEFINEVLENNIYDIEIYYSESCLKSINDNIEIKEDKDGGMLKIREKHPKTGATYEPYGHFLDTDRYFICKVLEHEYKSFRARFANYADASIPKVPDSFLKGGF
jgi:hypothetical protein